MSDDPRHGILTEDMKRVVREQRLGFVATVCSDGTPNLSPKGTTAVWDDDHLIFADIRSPGTVENLRFKPVIEVNVVDPFVRKGYRFKGPARVLTQGRLFEETLRFYSIGERAIEDAEGRIKGIVLMKVEQALPLISPAYDLGRSEGDVRRQWEGYFQTLNTAETRGPEEDRWTL